MKKLLLSLTLVSSSLFADVPEIYARRSTCQQLKDSIQSYGSIIIVERILFVKKRNLFHAAIECSDDENKERGSFKTLDVKHCYVGERCISAPSYSSSDSDYSSSSGSSGWSSDSDYSGSSSSSDWDSGPSSSGGSHYDPPSSGSTGSHYDPPSSGTRGSHYCPTC